MEFDVSLYLGDFYLKDSQITGNIVSFYASIASFYFTEFNLFFYNFNISDNFGNSIGAAYAALHFTGVVYFNNTIFQRNSIDIGDFMGGAAIVFYGIYTMKIFIKNCSFFENSSNKRGGALCVGVGSLYDSDSKYINNTSARGGSLYLSRLAFGLLVNGYFERNFGLGGALFVSSALITILNTIFESNYSPSSASVIYFRRAGINFEVI